MDAKRTITLETPNPLDLTVAELEELGGEITAAIAQCGLEDWAVQTHAEPPIGVANAFTDIVCVFLPQASIVQSVVWEPLCESLIRFLRKRFRRPHEAARPRQAILFGPDGRPLKIIDLPDELAEPVFSDGGGNRTPPGLFGPG